MSPFNDAVLNFYKGGKVVDLNVAIASDGKGTIAKVAGDAGKEAGLQLVASSEKVAVSEDMELFGATNDKFTFVVKGDGVPAGPQRRKGHQGAENDPQGGPDPAAGARRGPPRGPALCPPGRACRGL